MKKLITKWIEVFLKEDMTEQVKTIERIALWGVVLFLLVVIYLAQFEINLSVPSESGRKVIARKTLFGLFLEKR